MPDCLILTFGMSVAMRADTPAIIPLWHTLHAPDGVVLLALLRRDGVISVVTMAVASSLL